MDINRLLKVMAEKKASDLFITAGFPPSFKLNGRIVPVTREPLTPAMTRDMVYGVMDEDQKPNLIASMNATLQYQPLE